MVIEHAQLTALAGAIAKAAVEVPLKAVAAVAVSAHNVKDEARRNAQQTSGQAARLYPDTITYSLDADKLGAEIGPERRGQGNLGPILENGSVNNPPHRDLGRAFDDEEPKFLEAVEKLALPWI